MLTKLRAFYNALSHLVLRTIPQGRNWGSVRLSNLSKVNSHLAVELGSRARAVCPQSLPLATKQCEKDGSVAFCSLKTVRLALRTYFHWLCPCWSPLHLCLVRTVCIFASIKLCVSQASLALCLPGSWSRSHSPNLNLPHWPDCRLPSLIIVWFTKTAAGPGQEQESAATLFGLCSSAVDCRQVIQPICFLKIKYDLLF